MRMIIILLSTLLIAACSVGKVGTIYPESLISASSERVAFGLADGGSLDSISQWIEDDMPTKVEIYCHEDAELCSQAQSLITHYGVPLQFGGNASQQTNSIVLLYERVVARNCVGEFGCSISANAVQMVADYKQYTQPGLSDPQDAGRAATVYTNYQQ